MQIKSTLSRSPDCQNNILAISARTPSEKAHKDDSEIDLNNRIIVYNKKVKNKKGHIHDLFWTPKSPEEAVEVLKKPCKRKLRKPDNKSNQTVRKIKSIFLTTNLRSDPQELENLKDFDLK